MRGLVPLEIAAVIALAVAPLPDAIPVALPLFAVASVSRWVRGRDWQQRMGGDRWLVGAGAAAGLVALLVALLAGTPAVEAISGRSIEWSAYPIVRGHAGSLFVVALIVTMTAIATELALRGWIVERVLELVPGRPGAAVLAVLAGALAEALVTPGDGVARAGAAVFGAGLGWIYLAGGRRLVGPLAARLAFVLVALGLEALRLIG